MQETGVQRYSRQLVAHLADAADGEALVVIPPNRIVDLRDEDALATVGSSARWHGLVGHAWEQARLPLLVRRIGKAPLLSPASWGPAAVRRQVVYIHDVLPRSHGEYFRPGYRALFRSLAPLLMRTCARVATPSEMVAGQLQSLYRVPEHRLD